MNKVKGINLISIPGYGFGPSYEITYKIGEGPDSLGIGAGNGYLLTEAAEFIETEGGNKLIY